MSAAGAAVNALNNQCALDSACCTQPSARPRLLGRSPVLPPHATLPALRCAAGSAEGWRRVRAVSFPDGAANEFAHYRLADFSDNVNALPR